MDGISHTLRAIPARRRYVLADTLTGALAALWRRPLIAQNFAAMLGVTPTHPRAQRLARASVRNYGRMAIDFLMVRTMTRAEVLAWIQPRHAEYLDAALQGGRGAILALPHVGSWDVAAAFAQAYGYQLNVVTESNWVAELVAGSRDGQGVALIPRDKSLRPLFRALARNECAVMLADIVQDEMQAIDAPFFGRPAPFPLGPARLSQHTGAPIVVASCVRLPDNTYQIEAQPPLYPPDDRTAEEATAALATAVAAGFERIVAANPAQWYPFHAVWPH